MKYVLVFLSFLCLISCEQDNIIEPLSCECDYHEVIIGEHNYEITLIGGSGRYSISGYDQDVLDIQNKNNKIIVLGKSLGETVIYIKDDITGKTEEITVRVINEYLSLIAAAPVNPPYNIGTKLFLVNSGINSLFIFDSENNIIQQGTYSIVISNSDLQLICNMGGFQCLYDINGSSDALLRWLLDKHTSTFNVRSDSPYTLKALDIESGIIHYFVLSDERIPLRYI